MEVRVSLTIVNKNGTVRVTSRRIPVESSDFLKSMRVFVDDACIVDAPLTNQLRKDDD